MNINRTRRDTVATIASDITSQRSDPHRVIANAQPFLDWLAAAIDSGDQQARHDALYQHATNLELSSLTRPRTAERDWDALTADSPSWFIDDPQRVLDGAKVLYEGLFTEPAADSADAHPALSVAEETLADEIIFTTEEARQMGLETGDTG